MSNSHEMAEQKTFNHGPQIKVDPDLQVILFELKTLGSIFHSQQPAIMGV
jgi:hypothetical protein